MANSVIIDETELMICGNAIRQHAEFLERAIDSYSKTIDTLFEKKGISDDKVSPALTALRAALTLNSHVASTCGDNIASVVKQSLNQIEANDHFVFPQDNQSLLRSLLGRFL